MIGNGTAVSSIKRSKTVYHGRSEPLRGRVGRLGPAMIAGSNKHNVTGKRPLKGAVTEKKSVIQKTKNEPVVGRNIFQRA